MRRNSLLALLGPLVTSRARCSSLSPSSESPLVPSSNRGRGRGGDGRQLEHGQLRQRPAKVRLRGLMADGWTGGLPKIQGSRATLGERVDVFSVIEELGGRSCG